MKIKFEEASFKDFENIPELDIFDRSKALVDFLYFMDKNHRLHYRFSNQSNAGASVKHIQQSTGKIVDRISFVSNDYLGFSQHPAVKAACIEAIAHFGTGAGSSPLIGGHYKYLDELEDELCRFFNKEKGSALVYNTGYTTNSATLQALLKKEDIAIMDMAVHASVYEGCIQTNTKKFLHNNVEMLEKILKDVQHQYRTKLVVIDGVYSQDGDMAPIQEIADLCKKYKAYLMVDDAHGIGVMGATGRGAIELAACFDQVDIITGTLSKAFGNIGGFVIASPDLIRFLQYQSRQYAFSASASPAISGATKAIQLIDEEPVWQKKLWENIHYFKSNLLQLGLNVGTTNSAIIPIKIGDPVKTGLVGKYLLENNIYTNPILYPAVSKKDARIRMSVLATHTREQLDTALNHIAAVSKKYAIP